MDERFVITVEEEYAGTRMDAYLSAVTDNTLSRSFIQKLVAAKQVRVNGELKEEKKYKVKTGDTVEMTIPEPVRAENALPEEIPLDIVYEDEDVAVINKPRGMVVHPAPGNETGTLVNALLYHFKDLSSVGGVVRPGIVHRIDKDTSGLIMVAKNDKAHLSLSEQLKVHSITRIYRAVVWNNFREEEGTVDAPIARDPKNRFRMAVEAGGRNAVTHYRVLERYGQFTLIECRLETGRTHQIRVHMAWKKHPLLGDALYGPAKNPFGAEGQMLHAGVLGFDHPTTGRRMEFECDPPPEFTRILDRLRVNKI
ncbi:MAG: RluA family pseudouridine synthase [Firmicutes bacterium]|jgi:23S rRNA pseudouridine1911/1915/1917 synthase|nr:RluA family pseudouridine synthase [Bacillota bacterium]